ncbi:MAG: hypothetical protein Q7J42_01245 [Sulfuritalea sp.]|nr:hypothetical protein [Sulfuritalea sp.]
MKTTIEMPDDLFRRAKATAALQGLSMKDWLTNLLRREVGADATAPTGDKQQEIESFNRELDRLSALVTQHWQGEPDAVAAIREQRRG